MMWNYKILSIELLINFDNKEWIKNIQMSDLICYILLLIVVEGGKFKMLAQM